MASQAWLIHDDPGEHQHLTDVAQSVVGEEHDKDERHDRRPKRRRLTMTEVVAALPPDDQSG